MHARLEAEAARRRTSKSAVMREAFSRGQSSAPAGSFYEKARHLIGTASGPEDLATNPKHMTGYGKSRRP
jgi:hypothetical protein